MSPDPYAHFDAAYVLGALEHGERRAFEAHLATCLTCRSRVAEIAPIPAQLSGVTESVLDEAPAGSSPSEAGPVPDTLLPGLLRKARHERARRRTFTAGLAAVAAAFLIALLVVVWPSGGTTPTPPPRAMTPVITTEVAATVALQPEQWGTRIELTCWYKSDADAPESREYALVAYDASGTAYNLGNWRLDPGEKITFTSGTALTPDQIKSLKLVEPNGTPVLVLTT